MIRTKSLVNCLRLLWVVFLLNYEFIIFWFAARRCNLWKDKKDSGQYMLIGDPQMTDDLSYSRSGFVMEATKFYSDLYMRRNYKQLIRSLQPSDVFFMGDLMDHGRDWDDEMYKREAIRFNKLFESPKQTKHYMVGNHDVGFGNGVKHDSQKRFERHFGKGSYILYTSHGYSFIVLDTVALSSDDPITRKEALQVLNSPMPSSPRILMTHVPLHRDSADCGPDRQSTHSRIIREGAGYQYQNLVSKELSNMILDRIQPVAVFSGDDHDYCQVLHRSDVTEMTVPTFSMAQGLRYPGVMLLDISDSSLTTQLCWLPDQIGIFITYAYLLVVTLLVLVSFHILQWMKKSATAGNGIDKTHFQLLSKEELGIGNSILSSSSISVSSSSPPLPPLSSLSYSGQQHMVLFLKSVKDVAMVAIPTYIFCILFL